MGSASEAGKMTGVAARRRYFQGNDVERLPLVRSSRACDCEDGGSGVVTFDRIARGRNRSDCSCARPSQKRASQASKIVSAVLVFVMVLAMSLVFATGTAWALDTKSTTAKPNAQSGNSVMGATNTRVTWEGQAADDETIVTLTLTFPDGTDYSIEDIKVTMLSGDDLMTRTELSPTVTSSGQSVTIDFTDETGETVLPAGAYLRVIVYDIYFPREGGDMQLEGTYTLTTGEVLEMSGIPTITVAGISRAEQLSQWLEEQEWVQAWNSVRALRMFLDPTIIVTSFPVVFKGFLMAVAIVAIAFPLAIPFGFLLSLMRMAKNRLLRGLSSIYVNVVRGTPLFLQIYIAFFGLPLAGIQIPNFPLGVIVLALNSCAYMCEIFRAGIQSIPKGQFEAARSLGMNGVQTMMSVIVPQTVRRVIPTLTSEFILLYKDTSMLAAVGILEVVMYAKTIVASTGSITPYIVAAFFYLVITLPLAWLVGKLETRLSDSGSGAKPSNGKRKKARKGGVGSVDASAGASVASEMVETAETAVSESAALATAVSAASTAPTASASASGVFAMGEPPGSSAFTSCSGESGGSGSRWEGGLR